MDVLLARTVEILSECSTLWNSQVQNVDDIDRVVLNLEEIHCDISGFLQQDHLYGNFDLTALQRCFSQLIIHWKTKLTQMERNSGRPRKTINIELVSVFSSVICEM